jgi:hypothetical protein
MRRSLAAIALLAACGTTPSTDATTDPPPRDPVDPDAARAVLTMTSSVTQEGVELSFGGFDRGVQIWFEEITGEGAPATAEEIAAAKAETCTLSGSIYADLEEREITIPISELEPEAVYASGTLEPTWWGDPGTEDVVLRSVDFSWGVLERTICLCARERSTVSPRTCVTWEDHDKEAAIDWEVSNDGDVWVPAGFNFIADLDGYKYALLNRDYPEPSFARARVSFRGGSTGSVVEVPTVSIPPKPEAP